MNIWNYPLNNISYKFYAMRFYANALCTWNEFFEDLRLFGKLSKYIQQNNDSGKLISTRILLNTAIIISNVFSGDSFARLAFFIADESCYPKLKTLLYFMHRLPRIIPEVEISKIPFHSDFLKELNNL